MTDDDDQICTVCSLKKGDHGDRRHAFTPTGTRVDTAQFARKRRPQSAEGDDASRRGGMPQAIAQTPFDPVLRQALLDAGVISIEQLDAARAKIEAVTNYVMQPPGQRGKIPE